MTMVIFVMNFSYASIFMYILLLCLDMINIKSRNYVNDNIIKPLIVEGILDYTNKKHLNASNQKYKTKNK